MIAGRVRYALILCLFWAVLVIISFHFASETRRDDEFWGLIATSSALMIVGLIMFFGEIRLVVPYIFMSKEELSEYNVEKVSFVLGITAAAISYPFIFADRYGFGTVMMMAFAAVILIEAITIYTAAAERFKADAPLR